VKKTAPITTKVYTAYLFIAPAISHLLANFGEIRYRYQCNMLH